jgi:hypothetical protein
MKLFLALLIALAPVAASAQESAALATPEAPISSSSSAVVVTSSGPPSAAIMTDAVRPFSSLGIAVKAGVAGAGFDLATPLSPRVNLRGGASFFSYNDTFPVDGATLAGAIKFQNASAMLDFFPFHNAFRVSAGMTVFNDTGFSATLLVSPGQSFDVGDATFTSSPTDPIHGSAAFKFGNRVAPRFTFGTGNMLPKKGRFAFESEIGFQYIAQPTVALDFNGTACSGSFGSGCGTVPQADVANDLTGLRFFPIVSFGFSYKFGTTRPR